MNGNFRLRCTDSRYPDNPSWIVRKNGDVYAITPSGCRGTLFYGGIQGLEQEVKFKLEDAVTPADAKAICEANCMRFYSYEVI